MSDLTKNNEANLGNKRCGADENHHLNAGAKSEYYDYDSEIDLREIWSAVWKGKWIVVAVTFFAALASIIYVLLLPDVYRSSALLVPSEEAKGGGLSGLASQFGGLASLAGINLNNGSNVKVVTAIEVMKSHQFIINLIDKHDMLIPLMAVEGWDRKANKLIVNPEIYDETSNQWVREVSWPKESKPSMIEAYEKMIDLLAVDQDQTNGFVSVSVEHYSPFIARKWVETIIKEINLVMKEKDVKEAEKSVTYLSQQLEKTPIADMKSVFYQLIEEQSKTMMLAEVREEYVFSTIDPPIVAEEKVKPKRALICTLSVMLGGMLAIMFVLVRHLFGRK